MTAIKQREELSPQVEDLVRALRRITSMRRQEFTTGFEYELAVRQEADKALDRLARGAAE